MENDSRSVLLTNFDRVDAAWFDLHPTVKILGSPTTGLDHIDLQEAERRGVRVVSLQGEREFLNTVTSTAELTWGLILALHREFKRALFSTAYRQKGYKLAGKTLGIIGVEGRIGSQVKKIGEAFSMNILGVDKGCNIAELLAKSDVVTVHIPLQGNESFLKQKHFKAMKPSAFFVNTSRTGIMEKGALLTALEEGWIAGAALDFVDDPALSMYNKRYDNLIITNHLGGNTFEDRAATDVFIQDKMNKCAV